MLFEQHKRYRASKVFLLALFCYTIFVVSLSSCEKKINIPEEEVKPVEATRTTAQKLRDSVCHYYKLYTLWPELMPTVSPISDYTDQWDSPQSVLNALKQRAPLDRFSFIDEVYSGASSARADMADGYGVYTQLVREGSGSTAVAYIYIYFVEGGSPAALAGIQRGDKVIAVGDRTDMSIPLRQNGSSYTVADNSNVDFFSKALELGTMSITVKKDSGVELKSDLVYKTYDIDPLLVDTVFQVGGKNIGYFALSSFEEIYKSGTSYTALYHNAEAAFKNFEDYHIQDLIVDLRYNIGGYVNTAEYFSNKIINSAGDKKIMYTYETNEYLKSRASGMSGEFTDVYFAKKNNLELKSIYFLVSSQTASAAEILISVMKPYFQTHQIIAEQNRTYGKPVGFFPQEIMGRIDLWVSSFKTVNAAGYKDYWNGIPADKANVFDDIFTDFGDPAEEMTAEAISHILTGGYIQSSGLQARAVRQRARNFQKIKNINDLPTERVLRK